jgi:hypothetical protein
VAGRHLRGGCERPHSAVSVNAHPRAADPESMSPTTNELFIAGLFAGGVGLCISLIRRGANRVNDLLIC